MFVANQLKNTIVRPNNQEFRDGMLDALENVVYNFIQDKPMFQMDNFSAIYFDEYSMNTNCHKDCISTLFLVIDQPNNYKFDSLKTKPSKFKEKIKLPNLYFSLEDIKKGIYDGLLSYLDPNNTLWQDSNSIFLKSTDYDEEHGINNYFIKIIPALAYYNKDDVKGIMYLINGQTQIEYPDLALENFNNKNFVTDDLYRQTILIFKNILLKDKNIETLPSEIIETILYNVPTQMFINDSYDNMIKIINYIRNMSLKEIKTLDEEDFALTSIYRSMSPFYVKHINKIIEKYLITIK